MQLWSFTKSLSRVRYWKTCSFASDLTFLKKILFVRSWKIRIFHMRWKNKSSLDALSDQRHFLHKRQINSLGEFLAQKQLVILCFYEQFSSRQQFCCVNNVNFSIYDTSIGAAQRKCRPGVTAGVCTFFVPIFALKTISYVVKNVSSC